MPRPRFLNLPDDKRRQILRAAAHAFADHGYEGASISKILARAGISTGAAYYYFDNKADLFCTVVQHTFDSLFNEFDLELRSTHADAFWNEIVALVSEFPPERYELHHLFGALRAAWKASSEARSIPEVAKQFDRQHQVLHMLVDHGVRVGAIRSDIPPDLLTHMLLAIDEATDEWMLSLDAPPGPAELGRIAGSMIAAARIAFAPPKEGT